MHRSDVIGLVIAVLLMAYLVLSRTEDSPSND
jgi:hypothetical protein